MSDHTEFNGSAMLQTGIKEAATAAALDPSLPIGPTPLAADSHRSLPPAPRTRRPRHRWVVPPPA